MFLDEIWHSLDPVAFSIGPIVVRWYALAYVLGVGLGSLGLRHTAGRWGLRIHDDAISIIMAALIVGIVIGGRLGYVIVYGGRHYVENPGEILQTWRGGMSFHGGLVGAVVSAVVACRLLGINPMTYLDLMAIWTPLGLMLGRCANFVNGELWGRECNPATVPWAVMFDSGGGVWRHPSQLYEAMLEGLLLLVIMQVLSKRRPVLPQGTFSALFLVWYGTSRILVEFVRVPDRQIGYLAGGWLTMGQLLSLPMLVAGVAWLILATRRNVPQHAFLDGRDMEEDCEDVAGDVSAMVLGTSSATVR